MGLELLLTVHGPLKIEVQETEIPGGLTIKLLRPVGSLFQQLRNTFFTNHGRIKAKVENTFALIAMILKPG